MTARRLVAAALLSAAFVAGAPAVTALGAPQRRAGVTVCYRAPRPARAQPIDLSDATAGLGLVPALHGWYGHATAVGDVNGDGWTDVFFGGFADKTKSGGVARSPDRLLLGGKRGFRVDETFAVDAGRTSGAAFADLDGDGDLDLVLSRNVRDTVGGRGPSLVLRNDGGRLTPASVLDDRRGGRSIGVLDYDGDGRPDLFLAEDRFSGGSSVLFHNDGKLRFSDATAAAGLPTTVDGLGVAAADLNGDGAPDLFVGDSNRLFVNTGRGTFREAPSSVFRWKRIGDEDDPAGVAVGDVNRDGRPDLVIGQHYNSTLDRGVRVAVRLYLNDGTDADGTPRFRDVTEAAGLVPLPTKAPHVEIVDLDNDGWPDVLTTASAAGGTRPAIFRNLGVQRGVPRFEAPEGTGAPQYWIAGATLDVDRDGDLDVFLVEFDTARTSLLLRNDGTGGHWLAIQVGPSGAAGVGASVEVARPGELGKPEGLLGARQISASTGFGSGSLPIAFFGLGDEAKVDVRIRVAGTGGPVTLRGLPVDRLVQVRGAPRCHP